MSQSDIQKAISLSAVAIIIRLWKLTPPEQHQRVKILVLHELASICRTLWPKEFDLGRWVRRVEAGLAAGRAELDRQSASFSGPK